MTIKLNKRNQVLIFIDWFLPAYKAGGPIKSVLNLTNCLSDTHDFYIISSNRDLDDTIVVENSILNKWIERKIIK